jgi:hypothetical protein
MKCGQEKSGPVLLPGGYDLLAAVQGLHLDTPDTRFWAAAPGRFSFRIGCSAHFWGAAGTIANRGNAGFLPMPNYLVLRLLRVGVRAGGRLMFGHREGAIRPIDESWWDEVLHDPRARVPTEHYIDKEDRRYAHYRLESAAPGLFGSLSMRARRVHQPRQAHSPGWRQHERDLSGARVDAVPRAKQDVVLVQGLCGGVIPRSETV